DSAFSSSKSQSYFLELIAASQSDDRPQYVLEQDKSTFVRLIGVSVLQSAASSFVAPSMRHLTARLALG
nr:ABC transporter D family member 1 isoform X1 [Tanacetum cinerariifolium]